MTSFPLKAVLAGRVKSLGPRAIASGIMKSAVADPTRLSKTGFDGDAQGDLIRHGGPDKAIHHYPFDHYASWRVDIGAHQLLDQPGAFGENLSTVGLAEDSVSVGDVFELGTATIEVSQGRQPCWKLNERFGRPEMARAVQSSGRTGWYYRVLSCGVVAPADRLLLVARRAPEWTISRIWRAFYVDTLDHTELGRLSEVPALSESWRSQVLRRLKKNEVEDWSKRLTGLEPDSAFTRQ